VLHYETGLLNRLITIRFFDTWIQSLDLRVFGCLPNREFSRLLPGNFFRQLFHLSYFSYYLILSMPLLRIYLLERSGLTEPITAFDFQFSLMRAQNMLYGILLTVFCCFWIFILFPVAGPTSDRAFLFTDDRGVVALMNWLFRVGDLDGGAVPSSHVAVSLVIVIYVWRFLRSWRIAVIIAFMMLSVATVYCSYHYAVDIIGGIAAGLGFYCLAEWSYPRLNAFLQSRIR